MLPSLSFRRSLVFRGEKWSFFSFFVYRYRLFLWWFCGGPLAVWGLISASAGPDPLRRGLGEKNGEGSTKSTANFFFLTTLMLQWDFSHGKFESPSPEKASCDRVALPAYDASMIDRTLTWTTGSLTCTQMEMHAIAHGGVGTP